MLTYHHAPLTCSMAAHIALEEAGAAFEPRLVRMADREAMAEYRKVNPKGTVPALVVDGQLLTESVAIMTYVARTHPQAALLPEEPMAQAQVLSLCAWFSSSVHISRRQVRAPHRFTADEAAQAALRVSGKPAYELNLKRIDDALEGREWMAGSQFTIADGYALLFYDWGLRDEMPMQALANFTRFKDRMLERPAVRRALERERSRLLDA